MEQVASQLGQQGHDEYRQATRALSVDGGRLDVMAHSRAANVSGTSILKRAGIRSRRRELYPAESKPRYSEGGESLLNRC
jgi:hypothetical protein